MIAINYFLRQFLEHHLMTFKNRLGLAWMKNPTNPCYNSTTVANYFNKLIPQRIFHFLSCVYIFFYFPLENILLCFCNFLCISFFFFVHYDEATWNKPIYPLLYKSISLFPERKDRLTLSRSIVYTYVYSLLEIFFSSVFLPKKNLRRRENGEINGWKNTKKKKNENSYVVSQGS